MNFDTGETAVGKTAGDRGKKRTTLTQLRFQRLAHGLRQVDVERLTKISQPRYSQLELGQKQPTPKEAEKLQKLFEEEK
jgi:predicted transcriptional regulator